MGSWRLRGHSAIWWILVLVIVGLLGLSFIGMRFT
jgi:hypothetical protein